MSRGRSGVTLIEVVVVALVVSFALLIVMAALPRRREAARLASCRGNLMRIGQALTLYERAEGRLPRVPAFDQQERPGPCLILLETLGLPDFLTMDDAGKSSRPKPLPPPRSGRIPGFLCLSDPNAASAHAVSPISYRACAGDDSEGTNGAFAPGRSITLAEVEEGDGRSYTAAFSERLLGTGIDGQRHDGNYGVAPLQDGQQRCPPLALSNWKGDAGDAWPLADWRSTLYNHALTPNSGPSCIGSDGRLALMGASSGHVEGVNVLILDGGVRTIRPTIAAPIWKALATTHSSTNGKTAGSGVGTGN